MKKLIRRTYKTATANVSRFDADSRSIKEDTITVPFDMDTPEKALAYIRDKKKLYTVVAVDAVTVEEKLFGMEESDFFSKAVKFSERSKNTRDMITKTVKTPVAVVLFMNKDRTVGQCEYIGIETDKQARKACDNDGTLFIQIVEKKTVEQLCGMSPVDFQKNAREMEDEFHFKSDGV